MRVLDRGGADTMPQSFLSLGLIGQAARSADAVDVQAQGLEGTAQYAAFVTAAATQARAASPNVVVPAGLSTNPDGRPIAPAVLTQDADAVRGDVDGYWLDIPSAGPACRRGTASPQVAVPWLERIPGGALGYQVPAVSRCRPAGAAGRRRAARRSPG